MNQVATVIFFIKSSYKKPNQFMKYIMLNIKPVAGIEKSTSQMRHDKRAYLAPLGEPWFHGSQSGV